MTRVLQALFFIAITASSAHAQYVSGSLFGDIKRFSGDIDDPVLNGEGVGGGLTIGTALHPRLDLQVGVDVPRFTSTSRDRNVTFQRNVITMRSVTGNQTLSVSALVRVHGVGRGRVQLGYLAGLSIVRLRRDFHTEAPADTPASLIPRPAGSVAYAAGPTLGIDASIAMTPHLAFVPGVRATVFSMSDASGVYMRPRVALRWTF